MWQQVLLGVSLACSIVAGVGGVPELRAPIWQPAPIAFSIWGVIYVGLAFTVYAVRLHPQSASFAIALASALLSSAGWLVSVRVKWYATSAVLICAACGFASAALLTATRPSAEMSLQHALLLSVGPGLYAGWLGCAAGLGVNIAIYSRADSTADLPPVALLPGTALAAVCAYVARNPATGAAILWAVALIRSSAPPVLAVRVVGAAIALASSVGAVLRWPQMAS